MSSSEGTIEMIAQTTPSDTDIPANGLSSEFAVTVAAVDESSTTHAEETVGSYGASTGFGFILTSGVISAKNSEATTSVTGKSASTKNTQTATSVTRSPQASQETSTIKLIKFAPKTHEAAGAAAMGSMVIIIMSVILGCIALSDLPLLRNHFGIMLGNLGIFKQSVSRK